MSPGPFLLGETLTRADLAWLPFVGDALCAAAGWLRVNWLAALGCMALGRLARYLAIAALSA